MTLTTEEHVIGMLYTDDNYYLKNKDNLPKFNDLRLVKLYHCLKENNLTETVFIKYRDLDLIEYILNICQITSRINLKRRKK